MKIVQAKLQLTSRGATPGKQAAVGMCILHAPFGMIQLVHFNKQDSQDIYPIGSMGLCLKSIKLNVGECTVPWVPRVLTSHI